MVRWLEPRHNCTAGVPAAFGPGGPGRPKRPPWLERSAPGLRIPLRVPNAFLVEYLRGCPTRDVPDRCRRSATLPLATPLTAPASAENGATAHPDVMALVTKIDSFDISELGHTHLIAGRLF